MIKVIRSYCCNYDNTLVRQQGLLRQLSAALARDRSTRYAAGSQPVSICSTPPPTTKHLPLPRGPSTAHLHQLVHTAMQSRPSSLRACSGGAIK